LTDPILRVSNLRVVYPLRRQAVLAVDDVSFELERGGRLGIVGESGSGKSTLGFSILRLLRPPGRIETGSIEFEGRDLIAMDEATLTGLRGSRLAMVYQDPFTYLNPVMRVGIQVAEVLTAHRGLSRRAARDVVVELLQRLDLPNPAALMEAYPHQLSGGQRQRIVIATAVALAPSLLIADEPTTALDVTVQAQILQLLASLAQEQHISLVLISHDLGVVRAVCDQVAVMYRGRIVETGAAETVLSRPRDPYTKQLVTASARLGDIAVTSRARMQDPA
jgi:ABC-type dipeptide/oligopeptide/nickel transport system ATPase component